MRMLCGILMAAGLFLSGCEHAKPRDATQTGKGTASKVSQAPGKHRTQAARPPKLTPVSEPSGRVASVNSDLRFAVIDFFFSQLPKIDERLGVYRQGQKVGEVKISGPDLSNIIAADIVEGEAKVGDEVRPE